MGRLTLLRRVESNRFGHSQWLCRCECGGEKVVSSVNLKTTFSCGCLRVVHHQSRTTDWNRWNSMVARCHYATSKDYPRYGGVGITVCERWQGAQGFLNYVADMGPRPSPKHTVDRIDGTKGYSPENCRWATPAEQSRNRKDNVRVEHDGQSVLLCDLAAAHGLHEDTVRDRWARGDRGARLVRPTGTQSRRHPCSSS